MIDGAGPGLIERAGVCLTGFVPLLRPSGHRAARGG